MKPIKKAVVANGKYVKDGQEKTRYLTVGTLFQRDDGSVCMKQDVQPVGQDYNGWINFYDLDENRQQARQPADDADVPF